MAVSTQRLIIIFFALNIFIGIVSTIYQNPTITTSGLHIITTETNNIEDDATKMQSDNTKYSGITSGLVLQETTVGNPITTSGMIWKIFTNGFNPFAILPSQSETTIETLGIYLIMIMKSMIYMLLIYELYIVLKNKKTS